MASLSLNGIANQLEQMVIPAAPKLTEIPPNASQQEIQRIQLANRQAQAGFIHLPDVGRARQAIPELADQALKLIGQRMREGKPSEVDEIRCLKALKNKFIQVQWVLPLEYTNQDIDLQIQAATGSITTYAQAVRTFNDWLYNPTAANHQVNTLTAAQHIRLQTNNGGIPNSAAADAALTNLESRTVLGNLITQVGTNDYNKAHAKALGNLQKIDTAVGNVLRQANEANALRGGPVNETDNALEVRVKAARDWKKWSDVLSIDTARQYYQNPQQAATDALAFAKANRLEAGKHVAYIVSSLVLGTMTGHPIIGAALAGAGSFLYSKPAVKAAVDNTANQAWTAASNNPKTAAMGAVGVAAALAATYYFGPSAALSAIWSGGQAAFNSALEHPYIAGGIAVTALTGGTLYAFPASRALVTTPLAVGRDLLAGAARLGGQALAAIPGGIRDGAVWLSDTRLARASVAIPKALLDLVIDHPLKVAGGVATVAAIYYGGSSAAVQGLKNDVSSMASWIMREETKQTIIDGASTLATPIKAVWNAGSSIVSGIFANVTAPAVVETAQKAAEVVVENVVPK